MFRFFRKKAPPPAAAPDQALPAEPSPAGTAAAEPTAFDPGPRDLAEPAPANAQAPAAVEVGDVEVEAEAAPPAPVARSGWMQRLRQGLRKTSTGIARVFTGVRIDEALWPTPACPRPRRCSTTCAGA